MAVAGGSQEGDDSGDDPFDDAMFNVVHDCSLGGPGCWKGMYTREGDEIEMRTVLIYMNKRVFCMLCVVCVAVSRTGRDGQVLSERKQQSVRPASHSY